MCRKNGYAMIKILFVVTVMLLFLILLLSAMLGGVRTSAEVKHQSYLTVN